MRFDFVLFLIFAEIEYKYNIPAKDRVIETLKKLRAMGYSINLLTAASHRMFEICLERLKMNELFDNMWSSDDFGFRKTQVEIYYAAASSLGVSTSDCIFFDDNFTAVSTAKKSGMTVIGVYDVSPAEYVEKIKLSADAYIYKMDEILQFAE